MNKKLKYKRLQNFFRNPKLGWSLYNCCLKTEYIQTFPLYFSTTINMLLSSDLHTLWDSLRTFLWLTFVTHQTLIYLNITRDVVCVVFNKHIAYCLVPPTWSQNWIYVRYQHLALLLYHSSRRSLKLEPQTDSHLITLNSPPCFSWGLPHSIHPTLMFTVNASVIKLLKCTPISPPQAPPATATSSASLQLPFRTGNFHFRPSKTYFLLPHPSWKWKRNSLSGRMHFDVKEQII